MMKHSNRIISLLMAAVLCIGSGTVFAEEAAYVASPHSTVYDGKADFFPQSSDVTFTRQSGAVVAGKSATDAFYKKTSNTVASKTLHIHAYNPGDMYISFDFRLTTENIDGFTITPQFYNADKTATIVNGLFIINGNGVVLANSDVLAESMRGVTLVEASKVAKNVWHSISIDWCCLEDAIGVYFDGVYYSVPINTAWKTDANGTAYSALRYGTLRVDMGMYFNRTTATLEFDNLLLKTGYQSGATEAWTDGFIDANETGGHKNHLTTFDTDSVKNAPVVSTYNGKAVSGDTISIMPASTASEVIENTVVGEGCGTVRLYSDSTCATALTGDDTVSAGAVLVVPAVNANGVERIYKTYSIEELNCFSYSTVSATDTTYMITGFSDELSPEDIVSFNGKKLTLPATIDGISVTRVNDYAFYTAQSGTTPEVCYEDIDFVIPASIGVIGTCSFKKSGITSLSLGTGNANSYVGSEGFADCERLASLTFGAKFVGCRPGAFKSCDALTVVDMSPVTIMMWNPALDTMFMDCKSLEEITVNKLPNTYLPLNFLKGCTALEKITVYDANITSKIFAAAYDEDMRLTRIVTAAKANESDAFSTITLPAGTSVKLFQFNSLETLVPDTAAMQIK